MERRRTLARAIWTIAIALLALLFLKIFVVDVKHVESSSMEPTIFGSPTQGESVLVLYGAFEPKRFDYVAIAREGEAVPIVKRIIGLPTESVQIAKGDVLFDGKRLPPEAPRPPPVPLYDSRLPNAADAFVAAIGKGTLWRQHDGEWSLDARSVELGSSDGLQSMHRTLTDGYLASDGSLVRGDNDVNDVVVECDVLVRDAKGRALFDLAEQGDLFRFSLEPTAAGRAIARITRLSASSPDETLASKEVPLPLGGWTHVRCSNVDNNLAFEIARADAPLCVGYAENRFEEGDHLKEGRTTSSRVRFGGEGGAFEFRALRVLRDLWYTARGTHGVREPADLGPDEYFVLGDNSASSQDSREWGPVHASWIVGRPIWVVWPPSSIRPLPAAVPGPCGR